MTTLISGSFSSVALSSPIETLATWDITSTSRRQTNPAHFTASQGGESILGWRQRCQAGNAGIGCHLRSRRRYSQQSRNPGTSHPDSGDLGACGLSRREALVSPAGTGLLKEPRAIPSSRSATAPAFLNNEGPNNTPYFKALLNGFFTRCLRFMPPLPTTMQDSLPAGRQPLPGGLDLPLGCDERFMFKRRTVLLS